jgi:hypothetical protein
MPLQFILEPAGGAEVVDGMIERFLSHPNYLAEVRLQDPTSFQRMPASGAYAPLALYGLNIGNLARGGGLEHVKKSGFCYLIEGDGQPVGCINVRAHHADKVTKLKFSSATFGQSTKEIVLALNRLASFPSVVNMSYEVRLLHAGAIPLLAIWLKPLVGADDLLYPVAYGRNPLADQGEPPYSASVFLEALRPAAQRVQRQAVLTAAFSPPRSPPALP